MTLLSTPTLQIEGRTPLGESRELSQKFWGDVTDPESHDPDNFRYLVHGVSPLTTVGAERMAEVARNYGISEEAIAAQRTDLLHGPEDVNKRMTMSTSLIDTTKRATWKSTGLILGVPKEDVLIMGPHDRRTVHGSREWLEEHNRMLGQPNFTPDELLQETLPWGHNEVAVAAGEAALLGFFSVVHKTPLGITRHLDPDTARLMSRHAKRLGLPFIKIPERDTTGRPVFSRY